MERQLDTPDSASITVVSVTVIFSTCSPGRLSLRVSTTRSWRLRNGDKRHQSGCLLPGIIPAAWGPPAGPTKRGTLNVAQFFRVCLLVCFLVLSPSSEMSSKLPLSLAVTIGNHFLFWCFLTSPLLQIRGGGRSQGREKKSLNKSPCSVMLCPTLKTKQSTFIPHCSNSLHRNTSAQWNYFINCSTR